MAELAGPAAFTAGPEPEALDAALIAALSSGGARRDEGIARAAEFTWEASATAHVACYREAVG
jgi:hypothetical protein